MGWAAPGSRAKARGSSRRELFTAAGQPKGFERRGLAVRVVHETPRTATASTSCSLLADRGGDRGPATSCKRWLSTPAAGARCKPCGRAPAIDAESASVDKSTSRRRRRARGAGERGSGVRASRAGGASTSCSRVSAGGRTARPPRRRSHLAPAHEVEPARAT